MAIPVPKKYIADFEKMGLGLFVHWGLYSQLGRGEWALHTEQLDINEYVKLKDTFTAEDFNADEFVLTAKKAGFKYITLTTRHHDGFSLYDTCGLNEYDAPHSAAKRDLIREFVDACNKHGIMPMFYHTTLDWWNKDYQDDFDTYLEYLRKSVETLCKNYGKIGGLWFDGNWDRPNDDWKEDELYATIRKYQPEAMIINNTGLFELGKAGNPEIDSVTFEQGRPTPLDRDGMPKYLAAEMCQTLNGHWGVGTLDFNYKSPKELIENLCNCRRVGANYLLNIGPTAQGGFVPIQKELINIVGQWMKLYGEAIYNGKPCGIAGIGKNFGLKGENEIYLFFHDLARIGNENVVAATGEMVYCGSYSFGNVKDEISEIEWMDNSEKLNFVQKDGMLAVHSTGFPSGMNACVRVAKAKIK